MQEQRPAAGPAILVIGLLAVLTASCSQSKDSCEGEDRVQRLEMGSASDTKSIVCVH